MKNFEAIPPVATIATLLVLAGCSPKMGETLEEAQNYTPATVDTLKSLKIDYKRK